MAKIGVLSPSQKPTDQPERFVKKCAAMTLLRKNLATYITKHVIQMRAIRDCMPILVKAPQILEIPELLPIRKPDWFFTSYPIQDQRTCEYSS